MVIASGYLEVNEESVLQNVVGELQNRNVEVNEVSGEKVVFLIERDTMGAAKETFEALKYIDGVRNVYLAYYSLEGSDEPGAEEEGGAETTH